MNPELTKNKIIYTDLNKFISNLKDTDLFIYSEKALRLTNIEKKSSFVNIKDITINIDKLDEFSKSLSNVQNIITFGSGRATDIGKYLSNKLGIQLISIASLLSVNVFFTDKSCLIKNDKKITVLTKIPDMVIIDKDFLNSCNYKDNLNGLSEIYSIHTALFDWELANKAESEEIDDYIYFLCKNTLDYLINNYDKVISDKVFGLDLLKNLLIFTGFITNLYGNGRPESGSEHIFSKILEEKIKIAHGQSVALGILFMCELQENYSQVCEQIISANIIDFNKIKRDVVYDVLIKTKKRDDRYTILDLKDIDEKIANGLIDKVETKYEVKFR